MAGMPNSTALSSRSSSLLAPSSSEYWAWLCRWTNDRAVMSSSLSFPLDGAGRLAADVVHHPVDPPHLVHQACGDPRQEVVRQPRPVGGHEVGGLHRAQSQ